MVRWNVGRMAEGDIDLDAMLDSAFDESVATTAADKGSEESSSKAEDIDLDSILDDALSSVPAAPAATSQTGSGKGSVKGTSGSRWVRKKIVTGCQKIGSNGTGKPSLEPRPRYSKGKPQTSRGPLVIQPSSPRSITIWAIPLSTDAASAPIYPGFFVQKK